MSFYERAAFVLSLIVLVIILAKLVDMWAVSVSILLVMLAMILYKLHFEEKINEIEEREKEKKGILNKIAQTVERMIGMIGTIRDDIRNENFDIDKKLSSQKEEIEKKMKKNYYELADKIIDLENKTNKMKKTLGAYISYLEELLKREEEVYEEFSE
ncbi:MAG: hypothetical protein J7L43_03130 [Candidatus Aenigmarchaeota archaeon]|nr:hypothetical protein [Candidatus Aenigmarchaeota archaeon]